MRGANYSVLALFVIHTDVPFYSAISRRTLITLGQQCKLLCALHVYRIHNNVPLTYESFLLSVVLVGSNVG